MLSSTRALANGVLKRERVSLARAITLIESSRWEDRQQAGLLLSFLAKQNTNSIYGESSTMNLRLGIAGPPGAGKSSFIEKFGTRLISKNQKIAVLPIDPSSHISGGSILGDMTRMENLTRSPDAYIRATPTRGVLGGIAEHTTDVIFLCESAGFNITIVESVGLGQSEVDIDSAVDMLILLVPPGGGDGLQASKKGIMEAADLVIVNKADGDFYNAAKHTKADYAGSMQFIRRKHLDWEPKAMMISAHTGFNFDAVEEKISNFYTTMKNNGGLKEKRARQTKHWMMQQFKRILYSEVERLPSWQNKYQEIVKKVEQEGIPPRTAAAALFESIKLDSVLEGKNSY